MWSTLVRNHSSKLTNDLPNRDFIGVFTSRPLHDSLPRIDQDRQERQCPIGLEENIACLLACVCICFAKWTNYEERQRQNDTHGSDDYVDRPTHEQTKENSGRGDMRNKRVERLSLPIGYAPALYGK